MGRAINRQQVEGQIEGCLAQADAMAQDAWKSRYATYDELRQYMYGSAAAVGLMMTHVIGFASPDALPRAIALGEAMQLTNFIRDVGEFLRLHLLRLYDQTAGKGEISGLGERLRACDGQAHRRQVQCLVLPKRRQQLTRPREVRTEVELLRLIDATLGRVEVTLHGECQNQRQASLIPQRRIRRRPFEETARHCEIATNQRQPGAS